MGLDPFTLQMIQMALTAASMAYQQKQTENMKKKMDAAADARKGQKFTVSGTSAPLPIVYGKQRIGGIHCSYKVNSSYPSVTENADQVLATDFGSGQQLGSKNEFLAVQTALCHGGIEGIKHILVNDVDYRGYTKEMKENKSSFNHRFLIHTDGGTADASATGFGFPSTNKFTGCAYVNNFFKLNRNEPQYSGIPSMGYIVKGRKVRAITRSGSSPNYTYSLSSSYTYSNNPALCLLDYLLNSNFGRGLTATDVDLESFYNAADICDTPVLTGATIGGEVNDVKPIFSYTSLSDFPSTNIEPYMAGYLYYDETADKLYTQTQSGSGENITAAYTLTTAPATATIPLYECNITLSTEETIRNNIERILNTMGLSDLVWTPQGKYKLILSYPQTQVQQDNLVTQTFNEDNIVRDSVKLAFPKAQERFNQITVSFDNEFENFKDDTFTWPPTNSPVHQTYLTEDNNQPLTTSLQGDGVTSKYHAQALAEQQVRKSRALYTLNFSVNKEGLTVEPGDLIKVNIPTMSISNEAYRVESIKVLNDFSVEISAYKFDFSVLAWNVPNDLDYIVKPDFDFVVAPPTSLAYNSTANISGTSSGKLTWTAANDASVIEYIIEVRTATGTDSNGNTTYSNYRSIGTSTTTEFDLIGFKTGTYQFSVRSKNITGLRSERVHITQGLNLITVGKVEPIYADTAAQASNIQSLTVGNNQFVAFFINNGEDLTSNDLPIRASTQALEFKKFVGTDGVDGTGSNAKVVSLISSNYSIIYNTSGASPAPSSITLTANAQNFNSVKFKFTGGGTAFTDETSYKTGNTATFTLPSNISANTIFTFNVSTVEAADTSTEVANDSITLLAIKTATDGADGDSAYQAWLNAGNTGNITTFLNSLVGADGDDAANIVNIVMSNEAHVLPASSAGVVSSHTGSGTLFEVFRGSTQLTPTTGTVGQNQFKVTVANNANIIEGAGSVSSNQFVFADHSNISNNVDVIVLPYTITVRNEANNGNETYVKSQSLSKSKAGANGNPGANAKTVNLTSDDYSLIYDASGNIPTNPATTATLTASAQGFTSPEFSFKKNGVGATSFASGNTLGLSTANSSGTSSIASTISANTKNTYLVEVRENGSSTVVATDSIDIVSLRTASNGTNGDNAENIVTIIMTNEAHVFAANNAGTVTSFAGSGTGIEIFRGATALTATTKTAQQALGANEFKVSANATNMTLATSSSPSASGNTVTFADHTAMSADQGSITYTITVRNEANNGDETYTKTQSFSKSKQGNIGDTGTAAKTVNLVANEYSVIYNTSGSSPSPTSVGLTASAQNFDNPKFIFKKDGSNASNISSTSTLNLSTNGSGINLPNTISSTTKSTYLVEVYESTDTNTVVATDSIDIIQLKTALDGADGNDGADGTIVTINGAEIFIDTNPKNNNDADYIKSSVYTGVDKSSSWGGPAVPYKVFTDPNITITGTYTVVPQSTTNANNPSGAGMYLRKSGGSYYDRVPQNGSWADAEALLIQKTDVNGTNYTTQLDALVAGDFILVEISSSNFGLYYIDSVNTNPVPVFLNVTLVQSQGTFAIADNSNLTITTHVRNYTVNNANLTDAFLQANPQLGAMSNIPVRSGVWAKFQQTNANGVDNSNNYSYRSWDAANSIWSNHSAEIGGIDTPLFAHDLISEEAFLTKVNAVKINVDRLQINNSVALEDGGAWRVNKGTPDDDAINGIFFGNPQTNSSGVNHDFAIVSTGGAGSSDTHGVKFTESETKLINPDIYLGTTNTSFQNSHENTGTSVLNVSAAGIGSYNSSTGIGSKSITLSIVGSGGGGAAADSQQTGAASGGSSSYTIYNNGSAIFTNTVSSGAAGTGFGSAKTDGDAGENSQFGIGGSGGGDYSAGGTGSKGAGGGGGGGRDASAWTSSRKGGGGGNAGQSGVFTHDLTSYAGPFTISFSLAAGGAGGTGSRGNGGRGGGGYATYSVETDTLKKMDLKPFGVKAFVNFNGSGSSSSTATIRDSGNIASVYKVGNGSFVVTFSNAMANSNYGVTYGSGSTTSLSAGDGTTCDLYSKSAGGFSVAVTDPTNNKLASPHTIMFTIVGSD